MLQVAGLDAEGLIILGIKLIRVFVIGLIGWWLAGYVQRKMRGALEKVYPDMLRINLLVKIVSSVILATAILAMCSELGINISAILAAAGVMGVAIGFAAQTSVANIISGLFLMLEHPFNLDDIISVDGVEGRVAEINLFAIIMHTYDNQVVRIPHERLLKSVIYNLTQLSLRRYETTIKVAPHQNAEVIVQAIKTVIAQNQYCVENPVPAIRATGINADALDIFIGVWVPVAHLPQVRANFIFELKKYFDQQGIVFASELSQLLGKE